ncbi:hypothetical protein [Pedobacter cryophilus]|uniref:Uncharacterized protein n=1 Tax=Pedobacter cryophilus TaxID=2571271 RepID=A0A4U1BU40_9SPHI|nr:hypothetical protein [Pedobacter cryophilus]TKB95556.1 hypothetical protein FA046_16275 [Pedobacter cryophilus]
MKNTAIVKKSAMVIFRITLGIVLGGKILNWFLDFSDETNQILNIGMYCLIGIMYLFFGSVWSNKWVNAVFIICGLYLIIMHFFDKNEIISFIAFICMLTPLLIVRFYPLEDDEKELTEKLDIKN